MLKIQVSNTHADAIGSYLTSQGRSWRILDRTGNHVEDVATCETDASRDEAQAAMDRSVDVRGDGFSAIEWLDSDTPPDPLQGFSPDEIVVGAGGQTLAQAAEAEAGHDKEMSPSMAAVLK